MFYLEVQARSFGKKKKLGITAMAMCAKGISGLLHAGSERDRFGKNCPSLGVACFCAQRPLVLAKEDCADKEAIFGYFLPKKNYRHARLER